MEHTYENRFNQFNKTKYDMKKAIVLGGVALLEPSSK